MKEKIIVGLTTIAMGLSGLSGAYAMDSSDYSEKLGYNSQRNNSSENRFDIASAVVLTGSKEWKEGQRRAREEEIERKKQEQEMRRIERRERAEERRWEREAKEFERKEKIEANKLKAESKKPLNVILKKITSELNALENMSDCVSKIEKLSADSSQAHAKLNYTCGVTDDKKDVSYVFSRTDFISYNSDTGWGDRKSLYNFLALGFSKNKNDPDDVCTKLEIILTSEKKDIPVDLYNKLNSGVGQTCDKYLKEEGKKWTF